MQMLSRLREFYGLLPQPPSDPFQFFVWEILSRGALPARRDLAWQALRRIPALTPDSVSRTASKDLLAAVALAGPRRDERVEQIRMTAGEFKRRRSALESEALRAAGLGRAARLLRRMTELPRETLDRALLFCGGYLVTPLDDQSARVIARLQGTALPMSGGAQGSTLKRLRWSRELNHQSRRARRVLADALPRDLSVYREAVVYLRHHAQHTCVAVGPHCGVCPLAPGCAFRLRSALSSSTRPSS